MWLNEKKKHLLCVMSYYEVMVWGGASYVTGENFVIYVDSLFPGLLALIINELARETKTRLICYGHPLLV